MKKLKWIILEIIYFPIFLMLCILSLLFGIFNFRKGLMWLYKITKKL